MKPTIPTLVDLYPGSRLALARAMGCGRVALWEVERYRHVRAPLALLRKLHAALTATGFPDGSQVPSVEALVAAWWRGKRGRTIAAAFTAPTLRLRRAASAPSP